MKLIFLRHGIAVEHGVIPGLPDDNRPLTDDGRAELHRNVKRFAKLGIEPDVVLTSPLPRARQTAEIVATTLDLKGRLVVVDELRPGCTLEALAPILQGYEDKKQVMVVGHEPDFSEMISDLIGGGRLTLKKGGVARVDVPISVSKLQGQGELRYLLTPKQMK